MAEYRHDDEVPTEHYRAFGRQTDCLSSDDIGGSETFACLVEADTNTLQIASVVVSTSGAWGTFAFLPVIDGDFIRELLSKQLLEEKVSGKRILSGVSNSEFHVLKGESRAYSISLLTRCRITPTTASL